MREEIRMYIEDYVRRKYNEIGAAYSGISDNESLTNSGLFDSMEFFGLITEIEEHFNVQISFEDVEPDQFTTIRGLLDCVTDRVDPDVV